MLVAKKRNKTQLPTFKITLGRPQWDSNSGLWREAAEEAPRGGSWG